ncbi:aspartic peptidase, partial [Tanacetum coccineum]
MGTIGFVDVFPRAYALFQPYRISDHSPSVLTISSLSTVKPKPFKFFNFLSYKESFLEVVSNQWTNQIEGHSMYQVVQKNKLLKKPFRKLMHDQGNLHDRVNRLRNELDEVQKALNRDPSNSVLRDEEAVYVQAFNAAKIDEERFLKKKAKIEWLKTFLGTDMICADLDSDGLFLKRVSDLSNDNMTKPVTNEEIKKAMFGIGDDKAPGPDGFTSLFFKKGWDVVGQDVCNAILTNRVIEGIKEVVNDNQSAFVPGRRISDNILITQELMHNYHRDRGPPRCAFKVDIQKAYDTVDWCFLEHILKCFGFHPIMTKWIMACVTSTSFSLSIIGNIHGYFKGKRVLRQGDPLSPYLFTLVMEILMLILQRRVRKLPVKYLGVPLISSRLLNKDCKILVEKTQNRVEDWKNKSLSFAGQLQLCNSLFVVLFGVMENTREGKLKSHGKIFASQSTKEVVVFTTLRDHNGSMAGFSVKLAWEALRPRGLEVLCFSTVWFLHGIPRHA